MGEAGKEDRHKTARGGAAEPGRKARPAAGKLARKAQTGAAKQGHARKVRAVAVQQAKSRKGQPSGKSSKAKASARQHPAKAAQAQAAAPKRRKSRSKVFPAPPGDRKIRYAKCRPAVKRMRPAHIVLALILSRGFFKTLQPRLNEVEARRRAPSPNSKRRRGQKSQWTALEFEIIEMLRRVLGLRSCRETLAWLSSPKARQDRKILGFDRPRPVKGGRKRADGHESEKLDCVPSEGWMSDYRTKWFTEEERAKGWEEFCRELAQEAFEEIPELLDELDVLYTDGSHLLVHGTAPRFDAKGEVTNPKTSEHFQWAGYGHHGDSGMNVVFTMTARGTVVDYQIIKLARENERDAARASIPRLREVFALGGAKKLRVLSADAGFHSQALRGELHEVGVLENIHLSSHGNHPRAHESVAERDAQRFLIEGYPNWQADGHRHLHCACGQGTTSRRSTSTRAAGRRSACAASAVPAATSRSRPASGATPRTRPASSSALAPTSSATGPSATR